MTVAAALAGPLAALTAYPRFLVYRIDPDPKRPGKTNKFPIDAKGAKIDAADQSLTWGEALAACPTGAQYGVGFYFHPDDGFWFLDVDGAYADGQWSPLVAQLDALLPGAAREVSASGRGLHYIGRGPVPAHRCRDVRGDGLEFYTGKRFVALTGAHASGRADAEPVAGVAQLVADWFPPIAQTGAGHDGTGAREDWRGPEDDAELIALIEASTHALPAFGDAAPNATDAELWRGDVEVLAARYPESDPSKSRPFDASTAGYAMGRALAYWTGCDLERMERLLFASPFMAVSDWDEGKAYRSLRKRVSTWPDDRKVYRAPEAPAVAEGAEPAPRAPDAPARPARGSLLNGFQQRDLFHGCVYIRDQERAYVPGLGVLKPGAFNVEFGGYQFMMRSDNVGSNAVKSEAFAAFSLSAVHVCRAVSLPAFDPRRAPGEVFEQGGKAVVNTYQPARVARRDGDVGPFLTHLSRLLPDERDRGILLAWMAGVVQYPGVKFLWSPVVVGGKGDGKSALFDKLLSAAVGEQYTNVVKPAQMVGKHATWMLNVIFTLCDDVGKHTTEEWLDDVKTLITGKRQLVEPKGVDTFMSHVCTNIAFTSNHKRGIRSSADERRFAQLWCDSPTPVQTAEFMRWTDTPANVEAVAGFLAGYAIPDALNPALVMNAPRTSATTQAAEGGADRIDQMLEDAVAEGAQGFRGGLVTMQAFQSLLDGAGLRGISRTARTDCLERCGYVPHAAAGSKGDGWTDNGVKEAGGKKLRVFVKRGSLAEQLGTAQAVAAHLSKNYGPPLEFSGAA